MTARPSASYSLTMRVEIQNRPGMLGKVTSAIGKAGGDMTFTLNADTKKDGAPAVGSPVSVRYRTEGSTNVATAVTAQAAKPAKAQAKK